MQHGTVKMFDGRGHKMFGFIVPDHGNREVFFHYNNGMAVAPRKEGKDEPRLVEGNLRMPLKGDHVVFEAEDAPKGPKAKAWAFGSDWERERLSVDAQATPEKVGAFKKGRQYADVFDLPTDGPTETHPAGISPNAIGGAYGISWYEYFIDASTGETYKIYCCDGVNRSKEAYSIEDREWMSSACQAIITRCHAEIEAGATAVYVSKNERRLMVRHTHAAWLQTTKEAADGKQSSTGIDGGLVGHCRGIPVICDMSIEDRLPVRGQECVSA
jgi:cold shock CspA family protein